jgi:hypothetical protein
MVATLWQEMDRGGFSVILRQTLPLTRAQINLLQQAAHAEWTHLEPAIFGTLLTCSLDPAERHRLGAEYTQHHYSIKMVAAL